jgi:hypothetical protein
MSPSTPFLPRFVQLNREPTHDRLAVETVSQRINEFVHLPSERQKFVPGHLGQAIPERVDILGLTERDAQVGHCKRLLPVLRLAGSDVI